MQVIDALRQRVDQRLDQLTAIDAAVPTPVAQAVRYALLAPGKRLRPIVAMLIAEQIGDAKDRARDPGCAIEMVHTASLVFDDLPAMDDATLRRGRPTAHKAFGHDVAILAGIALLNDAFGVIADSPHVQDHQKVELSRLLSRAVGSKGLVGGQFLDLHDRAQDLPADRLEHINALKTAALFVAAAEMGVVAASGTQAQRQSAQGFGLELGLAFQLADDLIDDPAFAGTTGKDVNQDRNKPTVASSLGLSQTRQRLEARLNAAQGHLRALGGDSATLEQVLTASFGRFMQ